MDDDITGIKEDLKRVADQEGDVLCRAALRHIEALEAKLAEADDFIVAQAKDHNSNNIRLAEMAHSVRVLQAKLSSAVDHRRTDRPQGEVT